MWYQCSGLEKQDPHGGMAGAKVRGSGESGMNAVVRVQAGDVMGIERAQVPTVP